MAIMTGGMALGTADSVANQEAADHFKSITDAEKAKTNLQKGGRDQAVSICGG